MFLVKNTSGCRMIAIPETSKMMTNAGIPATVCPVGRYIFSLAIALPLGMAQDQQDTSHLSKFLTDRLLMFRYKSISSPESFARRRHGRE